jgi:uncharacterized repeat protein (TIGR01451 family)
MQMRHTLFRILSVAMIAAMLAAPVYAQEVRPSLPASPSPTPTSADGAKNPRGGSLEIEAVTAVPVPAPISFGLTEAEIQRIYGRLGNQEVVIIVQLTDPEVVRYTGGIVGLAPAAAPEGQQFNARTSAAQSYINYLNNRHAQFLASAQQVSPQAEVVTTYVAALNGMALRLPASDVLKISQLPRIKAVMQNGIAKIDTDTGPGWINAPSVWAELGGQDVAGEDVVVGIIDTGLWSPNPIAPGLTYTESSASLADDSSVTGGAYAFPFTSITGVEFNNHLGVCHPTSPQASDDTFVCNNKVIGGYWYDAAGIAHPGEVDSPLDESGHGTHTSSTAAGNAVTITLGAGPVPISGVAPRARIIAYKACWDEDPNNPNDGGCAFVDTTAAVNQAILDGVNVLNYSIGGGSTVGGDSTELAFLNARAAGIFVSASAGNAGPAASTVSHRSPWVNTSAAMAHNRDFRASLILTSTFTAGMPGNLAGASITDAYTGEIILAPLQAGDTGLAGRCNQPFAPGTFDGEIVVCRRGVIARVEKGANVLAGGAGGYILVNANDNEGLAHDAHVLPAIHLEKNATFFSDPGEDLVTYLAAAAAAEEIVIATLTGGTQAVRPGDVMASFSSRGPTNINLIKPDNAAPGVTVLAATSPQKWDHVFVDGLSYEFFNGTSMSSPHTAGAGALLMALYPDWSPAEIQSALMTGAVEILKQDGVTPANPFDQGSGRLNLQASMAPGLVFDIPIAHYQQVVSGTKAIETLNYPSMANVACLSTCSWERTARNVSGVASTYTWDVVSATPGLVVSLDEPSYSVDEGDSFDFTVTADVSALPNDGQYAFARIILTEDDTGTEVALPVAVIPVFGTVPSAVSIQARRDAGSYLLPDVTALEITELTVRTYGLAQAGLTTELLPEDTTRSNPYDNLDDGVFWIEVTVPAGAKRLVAEITESTSNDIDLFVGRDLNGNGPEASEELAYSATPAVLEYVNLDNPTSGTYWVLVQNWSANLDEDSVTLAVGVVPDSGDGSLDVTGPSAVGGLEPFDLRILWDAVDMQAGDRWYGAFDLGTDAANPGNIGTTAVDIARLGDDVVKTASTASALPGDVVTYTISINPNTLPEDLTYHITDTIPAGMTYVPGSATGGAVVVGDTLTWSGGMPAPASYTYHMTTSDTDPACAVPLATHGPYTDLASYGISPISAINGDTIWFSAFTGGAPFNVWGANHTGINFTDDGIAFFSSTPGNTPWQHQDIPNPNDPNNLLALLWRDMEVIYSASPVRGVSLASVGGTGAGGGALIEYDDIQLYLDGSRTMDMQVFVWRTPDNTPDPEIIFAYNNISGTWGAVGTIGVENADGTFGAKFGHNDANVAGISDQFAICFDWRQPEADPHVITYRVTVDPGTSGQTLTNAVSSVVNNPGSAAATTSVDVSVVDHGVSVAPAADSQSAAPGQTVTYTLAITNTGQAADTFDVSVGTTGSAFTTTAPSTVGPLAAGATTTVDVAVTIPPGAGHNASSVATVTFTSQGDPAVSANSVLTTTSSVAPVYGVGSGQVLSASGLPGATITYSVAVTNTGSSSDTFTVTVGIAGAAFTTTAPSTVGPLAPDASTTIDVVVNIPADAADGATSAATVTFTSHGDGSTSASSTLNTTATWLKIYFPVIGRD